MKYKYIGIFTTAFFAILLVWYLFRKNSEENQLNKEMYENYIQVKATVKRINPSGIRTKRTTILFVDYNLEGENRSTTIRRLGYTEGEYKQGDSIIIYIDPDDHNNIR